MPVSARPNTITFAFTIFVGHAMCVKPAATATFCVPPDLQVMISTTDSAAERLAEQFFPGGVVERAQGAPHVTEEHHSTSRGSKAGDDWVVGLHTPLPNSRVGIDRVQPSALGTVGLARLAERPERIERRHPRPGCPQSLSRNPLWSWSLTV